MSLDQSMFLPPGFGFDSSGPPPTTYTSENKRRAIVFNAKLPDGGNTANDRRQTVKNYPIE